MVEMGIELTFKLFEEGISCLIKVVVVCVCVCVCVCIYHGLRGDGQDR